MIQLYRIQRRDNPLLGCFRGHRTDAPVNRAEAHGFNQYQHPTPYEEGQRMNEGEYCAWASIAQFEQWFSTPAQRAAVLSDPEYEFVRLDVHTAIRLPRQSIFRYEDVISFEEVQYVETR